MRLEGLGQLKNRMTSPENEAANFRACSIVPQPTTLRRAPVHDGLERRRKTFSEFTSAVLLTVGLHSLLHFGGSLHVASLSLTQD
jgi:hypothetical protein